MRAKETNDQWHLWRHWAMQLVHVARNHESSYVRNLARNGISDWLALRKAWRQENYREAMRAAYRMGTMAGRVGPIAGKAESGYKQWRAAKKKRRRDSIHDYEAIKAQYLAIRPRCNTEAEAYEMVRQVIDSRPSDPTIRKSLKESNL